mmetsp:Transcript_35124/g.81377  ORF Transcript_35124/g.81377 Transcript_35124/m.81377 type:complete len:1191 (-) Transcript_35124:133-3705(-)|eukprot:CAMPEP_0182572052 /NCGR_PEP_ID=MMETSP1324-20130603/15762_1 /TAXON_ID=236786 /ORGANISM="Florenciella sp., Strain RCC1587" /LENGTH=1190 /DNA_ID=CAMNT_0024786835 /DNA_START=136 /DNA_END=3708 /DNA_ORIENTATION=+
MSYNPDDMLNLEKRTGIKNAEVDDFLRKVNEVQAAITGMTDGTVDPDTVEIEGVETEAQKAKKEEERKKRRAEREERDRLKKVAQKKEEKERWWRGADLFREAVDIDSDDEGEVDIMSKAETERRALQARYSSDYSRWNTEIVDDPASQAEQASREAEEEKKANDEFEKNNPDFCNDFKKDAAKRAETQKKQKETCDALRLKGNRYFKAKRFTEALGFYMDSLKEKPYMINTLTNVIQVHIKLRQWQDALEFADRAVYLNPANAKAHDRRSAALVGLGRLAEALSEARQAAELAPEDEFVAKNVKKIEADIQDQKLEAAVLSESNATKPAAPPPPGTTKSMPVAPPPDVAVAAVGGEGKASSPTSVNATSALDDKALVESAGPAKKVGAEAEVGAPHSSSNTSSRGLKKIDISFDSDEEDGEEKDTPTTPTPTSPTRAGNRTGVPPPAGGLGSLGGSGGGSSGGDSFGPDDIRSQYQLIDRLLLDLKDNEGGGGGGSKAAKKAAVESTKKAGALLDALTMLLLQSREARVYLRTGESQGLRYLCCRLCGGGAGAARSDAGAVKALPEVGGGFDLDDAPDVEDQPTAPLAVRDPDPCRTLSAICAAVVGERKSKSIVLDQGALEAGGRFVRGSCALGLEPVVNSLDTRVAAARLMLECMDDELDGLAAKLTVAKDAGAMQGILALLPANPLPRGGAPAHAMEAAGVLVREICSDVTCRKALLKLEAPVDSTALATTETTEIHAGAEAGKGKTGKKKKAEPQGPSAAVTPGTPLDVAGLLASSLDATGSAADPGAYRTGREAVAGAMANLLFSEEFRTRFALPTPPTTSALSNSTASDMAGVGAAPSQAPALGLLRLVSSCVGGGSSAASQWRGHGDACEMALAALMNACLEQTGAVKRCLVEAGGVTAMLRVISLPANKRTSIPMLVRIRAAGLLDRLAQESGAAESLSTVGFFAAVAAALARNWADVRSNTAVIAKAAAGAAGAPSHADCLAEREHLVRLLARIMSNTTTAKAKAAAARAKEAGSIMAIEGDPLATATAGVDEGARDPRIALDLTGALAILEKANVVSILVECLPPAATNGRGEVTAESVIMPPPTLTASLKESQTQIGNVLKCCIHILDQSGGPAALQLYDAGLPERIVALLANAKDTSIRKNSAIVLAKAMQGHPPANERIRELRGMEMMMQLGNQLA